jgi:predicted nucleic acid-binding protein
MDSLARGEFEIHMSVPLAVQYLDVTLRAPEKLLLSQSQILSIIEDLCAAAHRHEIHFLVRPVLPDPLDDMILELAVAARAPWIITHNVRDFRGSEQFGVEAIRPVEFLLKLRGAK